MIAAQGPCRTSTTFSLDDPARGPFLVVTREGIFVTALGRDMSPGDLPVVTRGQLDAQLAARVDYKARVEVFLQVAGERGGSEGVFVRLLKAAENLSREEMTALSAIQPIYEFSLFKLLVESVCHLDDVRTALLPILRRAPKLRKTEATLLLLRSYWRTAFLVGHLSVLTGMSGPKLFDRLPEELHEPLRQGPMSWGGFRQGMMVHAVRALWLSARLGRVQVGLYKDRLPGSKSPLSNASSGPTRAGREGIRPYPPAAPPSRKSAPSPSSENAVRFAMSAVSSLGRPTRVQQTGLQRDVLCERLRPALKTIPFSPLHVEDIRGVEPRLEP